MHELYVQVFMYVFYGIVSDFFIEVFMYVFILLLQIVLVLVGNIE